MILLSLLKEGKMTTTDSNELPTGKTEVADIFQTYGESYRQKHSLPTGHLRVMHRIEVCRTAALGGHIDQCDNCGFEKNSYNSCRNRHCPKCQTMTKEKWIADRRAELLPTGYFHVVFTVPHDINPIILCNKEETLKILFASVNETLQAFAKNPDWRLEGQLGYIAVLHTWTQTLLDHFHLHCLIPAGALSFDKKRWTCSGKKFLFKVESLAMEFKKRYTRKLERLYEDGGLIFPGKTADMGIPEGFDKLVKEIKQKDWIVYAKRPFKNPESVLEYLGRYTHRVAISNNRIKSIDNNQIIFSYKDRRDNNKTKSMILDDDEFIRRFLLHILPDGFMKIRYFGFMCNNKKKENLALIRKLIDPKESFKAPEKSSETVEEIMLRLTGEDITRCPHCKKGEMIEIEKIPRPQLRYDTS